MIPHVVFLLRDGLKAYFGWINQVLRSKHVPKWRKKHLDSRGHGLKGPWAQGGQGLKGPRDQGAKGSRGRAQGARLKGPRAQWAKQIFYK